MNLALISCPTTMGMKVKIIITVKTITIMIVENRVLSNPQSIIKLIQAIGTRILLIGSLPMITTT